MERLTNEQSSLLRRINQYAARYTDLTDPEKLTARFLCDLGYLTFTKVSRTVSLDGFAQIYEEPDIFSITQLGKMYLLNESLSADQELFLREQLQSLRDLAEAAQQQAEIAKADSVAASRDALFSKITSVIAIVISVAAILIPLIF